MTEPQVPLVPAARIPRIEDERLLRGAGTFTDDLDLPHTLHAAFVRSPWAHALLGSVDLSAALALPGVVAAFDGHDLADGGVNPIPTAWLIPGMQLGERRALAIDRVRYHGEPIAMIIAETAAAARDAIGLVVADHDTLPCVTDVELAAAPGAPTVYDDAPGNVCFQWAIGDADATDQAFHEAHAVVRQRIRNNRLIPNAIEPRACAASWNAGNLTLHLTSQNPHVHRLIMAAFVLGIPEHRLRVIAPDIGGAFGSKIAIHPEEVAVTWAARHLRRPVRWTATRRESFTSDNHGRDHVTDAAIAFDEDLRITALRVRTLANLGANLSLYAAAVPTWHYGSVLSGPYTIPAIHCEVTGVFSHTSPVDAYRGAGRPEATYVLERLLDIAARQLGTDPVALRRRNLVPRSLMPYRSAVNVVYDVGNYVETLEHALDCAGYDELREEQHRLRQQGRHMGIGVSCYVEASGHAPSRQATAAGSQAGLWESALVRVHPTGRVTVQTGSHDQGQGHETTYAQITAAALGVGVEDVAVAHGDTAAGPFGMGTHGSRGGPVGGTAVWRAARRVETKVRQVAAHLLGVAVAELEQVGGRYIVRERPDSWVSWQDVTMAAHLAQSLPAGMEPGLEALMSYDPPELTWPNGTHVAVVDVDAETGEITLRRYVAVDDCGNVVNPSIVEGQIHGGIVQGVAQALWEGARYDGEGRLLTGSLSRYAVPRASWLPRLEVSRRTTPAPSNPLGVKGIGEVGAIASPAAVVNAVMDALAPFGITHLDMPLDAEKVWLAISGSAGGGH